MSTPWTSPLQPRRPPRTPTDPRPVDTVVGRVVEDSDGPCYRVRTDDGTEHRLHGGTGERVERGQHVRALLAPPRAAGERPVETTCCPQSTRRLVRIDVV